VDIVSWLKGLLNPIYLPMLIPIAVAVKYGIVPAVKGVFGWGGQVDSKGTTPIIVSGIGSVGLAFLWKATQSLGGWTIADISQVLVVGIAAAAMAIGGNVGVQAIRGKDVSISPSK
jgi:hypothetical protein